MAIPEGEDRRLSLHTDVTWEARSASPASLSEGDTGRWRKKGEYTPLNMPPPFFRTNK